MQKPQGRRMGVGTPCHGSDSAQEGHGDQGRGCDACFIGEKPPPWKQVWAGEQLSPIRCQGPGPRRGLGASGTQAGVTMLGEGVLGSREGRAWLTICMISSSVV